MSTESIHTSAVFKSLTLEITTANGPVQYLDEGIHEEAGVLLIFFRFSANKAISVRLKAATR